MLTLPSSVKIHLATTSVDMRLGIDGLMAVVRNIWQADPFSGHLFVFPSGRRDRVKILVWDRGGFVLYYKRLERGRFQLPALSPQQPSVELDCVELSMLLDGIPYAAVPRGRRWQPAERPAA